MTIPQRTRMYRFWQALTVPALVIIAILTIDLVLHPLQPESYYGSVAYRLIVGLIAVPLIVVIGLLCRRHSPGNILGPLLIFLATGGALAMIRSDADLTFHLVATGIGIAIYWQSTLLFLLYFPDGKPYFRRVGKWVGRLIFLVLIFVFFSELTASPTLTYGTISGPSPFYVPAVKPLRDAVQGVLEIVGTAYVPFVLVSLIARYRAGQTRERQQLKWLLWSLSIWAVPVLLFTVFRSVLPPWLAQAMNVYSILFSHVLPLTAGLAIVRNQLYDIDIIIRRTLIYSALTAILAAVYFGSVVVVQQLFRGVIGQSSDLAIVISTLAIYALFSPLRRRIQNAIDRRFYRRKYDAEQTLARFNQTLRDEVDIATLKAQLVSVVNDTMQPNKIALWVKERNP